MEKKEEDVRDEQWVRTREEVKPEEVAPQPGGRGILTVGGPATYEEGGDELQPEKEE